MLYKTHYAASSCYILDIAPDIMMPRRGCIYFHYSLNTIVVRRSILKKLSALCEPATLPYIAGHVASGYFTPRKTLSYILIPLPLSRSNDCIVHGKIPASSFYWRKQNTILQNSTSALMMHKCSYQHQARAHEEDIVKPAHRFSFWCLIYLGFWFEITISYRYYILTYKISLKCLSTHGLKTHVRTPASIRARRFRLVILSGFSPHARRTACQRTKSHAGGGDELFTKMHFIVDDVAENGR